MTKALDMLTKLIIKNFKQFEEIEIPLDSPVLLIGPNNSGKTTTLQALSLWRFGLQRWLEKNSDSQKKTTERIGVPIGRKDLATLPIPVANLIWNNTKTRRGSRENGKTRTENIRIELIVEGNKSSQEWRVGLEFDYANDESIYVRPLITDENMTTWRAFANLAEQELLS